jgi:hypothetical protein
MTSLSRSLGIELIATVFKCRASTDYLSSQSLLRTDQLSPLLGRRIMLRFPQELAAMAAAVRLQGSSLRRAIHM